jgi:hypothetical protein
VTNEERAEIARRNGAKSKGPTTAAGKEQSKRNAIRHGDYSRVLKLLVPPHSACLLHEDRREFYRLFDTNIAKYQPADEHEKEIVREITDLQWTNVRGRLALHAMLNREIIRTTSQFQPLTEENFPVESIIASYDALAGSKTFAHFQKEYGVNVRLIVTLERRLVHVQRHWSGPAGSSLNCNDEREFYGVPVPPAEKVPEGTQQIPPQPVENAENTPKKRKKIINVKAPLTPAKIRLYQQVFPNRDLEFNVFEPEEQHGPIPEAA